ncbi:MAG TPA: hypothetical protein PKI93_00405 [Alphaproteobacteria bacterium]|nr:hypothetical protein [Alphaproteobacteria bacterium]HNS43787.1 hypothetical protein [Alphaproteobacteria bacterium]
MNSFGKWHFGKKTSRALFAGLAATLIVISAALPSRAEFVKYDKAKVLAYPTTPEEIILDFVKLANITSPEFQNMVVKTEKYKAIPENERASYLQVEMMRLNKKFNTLNPRKNGILIRIGVKVMFDNMADRQSSLTIQFPSEGLVYFPYYYGGLPVAVLVNGIEDFQKIYLTGEERQQVASVIDPTSDSTLILDLRPVSASVTQPVMLDGEPQYPLLCDIVYIGIHNKESDQVWAWQPDEEKEKPKTDQIPTKAEGFDSPQ